MTATSWSPNRTPEPIADPLTAPLATALASARPDDLRLLHTDYVTAAEQARTTSEGLTRAAADTQWSGQAADAFRGAVGELPRRLAAIDTAYSTVAAALSNYIAQLPSLQSQFQRYASSLSEARSRRDGAQDTYDTDRAAFEQALNAPGGPGHTADVRRAQATMVSSQHQLEYWEQQAGRLSRHAAERCSRTS